MLGFVATELIVTTRLVGRERVISLVGDWSSSDDFLKGRGKKTLCLTGEIMSSN